MHLIHRRSFLKQIAAAGLLASAGSPLLTRAANMRKMTIDLTWGAIGVKANQIQAIELAHRFGFESVAADASYLASLSGDSLRSLVTELKSKRLSWGASGLTVDFRGNDENFDKGLRDLPAIAAALQQAGVTRVSTWLSPGHAQLTYMQNFRQHAARLRQVAQILGDHGHRLGLEYVGPKTSWTRQRFPFVHSMAEMKDLIGEIGLGNVGFVLDSWHWYTAGETEADLISLTNEQVVAVDLNDAPAGIPVDQQIDSRRELPSATGVIDLPVFLNALNKMGYDGPVRAEPFNAPLNALENDDACAATIAAMKKAFALLQS
jgi:sugar phosphate isomerase/epimerase